TKYSVISASSSTRSVCSESMETAAFRSCKYDEYEPTDTIEGPRLSFFYLQANRTTVNKC
ncbi:MAG: hypothetical protein J6A01_08875, partial [Proteobacteria bacterium]|nr:hypothetical protein [Pseudomonadota bacterium]